MAFLAGDARPQPYRGVANGYQFRFSLPIFDFFGNPVTTGTGSGSISIDDGAAATIATGSGTVAYVASTNTWTVSLTAAQMNGAKIQGFITSDAANSTVTPFTLYPMKLAALHASTVTADANNSTTVIALNSTAAQIANYYNNCLIGFKATSVAGNIGCIRRIVSSAIVAGVHEVTVESAFTSAPNTGDPYEILQPADAITHQACVQAWMDEVPLALSAGQVQAVVPATSGGAVNYAPYTSSNETDPINGASKVGTSSGGLANLSGLDGLVDTVTNATNNITWMYAFDVGTARTATTLSWSGYLSATAPAASKSIALKVYDSGTSTWVTKATIVGQSGTTINTLTIPLVATNTIAGKLYVQFYASGQTGAVLTSDRLLVSAVSTSSSTTGYANGSIWVDNTNGVATSVSYIDGTADNPCKWAQALTLSTALKMERFQITPGNVITITADLENALITGRGYSLDMGSNPYKFNYTTIEGCEWLTGTAVCDTHEMFIWNCQTANCTLGEADLHNCHITGKITLSDAKPYLFDRCVGVRGVTGVSPELAFGATADARVAVVGSFAGSMTVSGMRTGNILYIDGNADITITDCSAGTIYVSGSIRFTNSDASAVTINREAHITLANIAAGNIANVTGNVAGNIGGSISGNVAGVTGNIGGSVAGNVAGNIGGSISGNVAGVTGNIGGSVSGNVAGVTGNIGGNLSGNVAGVTGNIGGSVSGNVAGVTGNIGGNLSGNVAGNVAGVTGNIGGSITGNVGGNILGNVASVANIPVDGSFQVNSAKIAGIIPTTHGSIDIPTNIGNSTFAVDGNVNVHTISNNAITAAAIAPAAIDIATFAADVGTTAFASNPVAQAGNLALTAYDGTGGVAKQSALGTPVALSGGAATVASMLTKIADNNSGAAFSSVTDSLHAIASTIAASGPTAASAASGTVTHGSVVANTYAATATADGVAWQSSPAGGTALQVDMQFNVGSTKLPHSLTILAYYKRGSGGSGPYVSVQAKNQTTGLYETISSSTTQITGQTGTTYNTYTYPLNSAHMTAAGISDIRFLSSDVHTDSILSLDYVPLFFQSGAQAPTDAEVIAEAVYLRLRNTVYMDGVYIDTNHGAAGTEVGVNGTPMNPVSNYADAYTIATTLGVKKFVFVPDSVITLANDHSDWTFTGRGLIDLGGQLVSDAVFIDTEMVSGAANATSDDTFFDNCKIDGISIGTCHMVGCALAGNITFLAAGNYNFTNCYDFNPTVGDTPALTFCASAGAGVRNYRGGLEVHDMVSTNDLKLDGAGRLVINGDCTGGTITIRGFFPEPTGTAAYETAGGTVTQTQRFEATDTSVAAILASLPTAAPGTAGGLPIIPAVKF